MMRYIVLWVFLAYVMVLTTANKEEDIRSLIDGIKDSYRRQSQHYDSCRWAIKGGESGLAYFFKHAMDEYRANRRGSQLIYICYDDTTGTGTDDYFRINWGPGVSPIMGITFG